MCSRFHTRRPAGASRSLRIKLGVWPRGLLFSAIPPQFYEGLGYVVVPAWQHDCARLEELFESGAVEDIQPISPYDDLATLAELYNAAHCGIRLARTDALWRANLIDNPDDFFVAVGKPVRGYVRLCHDQPAVLDIVELILRDPEDEPAVLRAVAGLALALGCNRIESWLAPSPFVNQWFEDSGRHRTLPMLRNWPTPNDARFWSSEYF